MADRRTFDLKDTERIRSALLAYKLQQGIGAPKLALAIQTFLQHQYRVEPRRVSNFLAKAVKKPDDMFLGWCYDFLQSLPQWPELPDPAKRMAEGLIEFCGKYTGPDLSGRYDLALLSDPAAEPEPPFAEVIITADVGFWRIEERWIKRHIIADGVLIHSAGTTSVAVLKDRLTAFVTTVIMMPRDERIICRSQAQTLRYYDEIGLVSGQSNYGETALARLHDYGETALFRLDKQN
jgi:hypothetical protein